MREYFEQLDDDEYQQSHVAANDEPFLEPLRGSDVFHNRPRGTEVVVDVGCGRGDALDSVPWLRGTRYVGVDVALAVLARSQCLHSWAEGSWLQGDAEALPLGTGVADFVFAINLLTYLGSPDTFFGEASRCLRPAGRLVVVTATPSPFWDQEFDGVRVVLPSRAEILGAASQVGLEVIEAEDIVLALGPGLASRRISYGFFCVLAKVI